MHRDTIILGGEAVPCTVRKSLRARRVSVTLKHSGEVIVTVPRRVSFASAGNFLKEKEDWIVRARARLARCITLPMSDTPGLYTQHKRTAERIIGERVAHFNRVYGFVFSGISIRNQKTRWGSCSSAKNLQFNYRLIFLPPHLRDYVVVHELCHLAAPNHGARFRAMVAFAMPEQSAHERQLRQYRII